MEKETAFSSTSARSSNINPSGETRSLQWNKRVGIVIPARNEEKNIAGVLARLKKLGYHDILVIDGKSNDRTIEISRKFGAKVVLQNGNGKGDAVRQVFNNGYLDVDVVVLMDADGSMPPDEIPRLVERIDSKVDVVKGSRFVKGGYTYDMSFIRRFGNWVFLSLVNIFWLTHYTDICYGFAAFTKRSIAKMAPELKSSNFEIETEIFIKTKKLGLKVEEVPSTELRRRGGKSNLSIIRDGSRILKTIFGELIG